MSWTPKDKEVESLLAAAGQRRYEYFVHRVCDTRLLYGLYRDGWASLGDGEEKMMPLWPHPLFAAPLCTADWAEFEPKGIPLDVFLERWIPGMKEEGLKPAVFPVPSGSAVVVSLDDLEANLRHELSEAYEEEG